MFEYDKERVEDSIEFCKEIDAFYEEESRPVYSAVFQKQKANTISEAIPIPILKPEGMEDKETFFSWLIRTSFEFLLCIGIAFVIAYGVTAYIGQHTRVDGISMEDTLHDRDFLIIDKLTYHFKEPERFDIIVFPFEENVFYIKRIIGLPGETIQIDGTEIIINGQVLKEDYGKEPVKNPGNAWEEIRLGPEEYFVMGDNRNHSVDSRFSEVGPITRDRILGRAWFRFFPFNRIGILKHQ